MKLIALAATAATTVSARRVNTPAPGFINEQGGYWADQSSDQSVQRPNIDSLFGNVSIILN